MPRNTVSDAFPPGLASCGEADGSNVERTSITEGADEFNFILALVFPSFSTANRKLCRTGHHASLSRRVGGLRESLQRQHHHITHFFHFCTLVRRKVGPPSPGGGGVDKKKKNCLI